jgi:hypothetical protein
MEKFELDRLESELSLLNEILDKTSLKDVYRVRQIILDMRLDREIKRVNLINKLRDLIDY